jgi:hypothetical protein
MKHKPAPQDLTDTEAQAVINQLALALAERFGIGVGNRPLPPRKPFGSPDEAQSRMAGALQLGHALHNHYGHAHEPVHTVQLLFGAPLHALHPSDKPIGPRTRGLILALERFAAMKRLGPERPEKHLHGKHVSLNNVEAAELAANRIELGTNTQTEWHQLPFADSASFQRLEVAIILGPTFNKDEVIEYATDYGAKTGTRTDRQKVS